MSGFNDTPNYWTNAEEEWNKDVERFMASDGNDVLEVQERVPPPFPICVFGSGEAETRPGSPFPDQVQNP